jgi:DNA mismatch endonuclease (patch repair protein)
LKVEGGKVKARKTVRHLNPASVLSLPSGVQFRTITIRPDFVFRSQRLAVFVDGCFFHGCPKHATWPKNNAAFWRAKIEGNIARDRLQNRLLRRAGWRALRIWEHALTTKRAVLTVVRLKRALFQ